jgi:hypothetical protein
MLSAQMIAKAWMNDAYYAELTAKGFKVPPRPEDLADDQLDLLTQDQEIRKAATDCCVC